jgi:hypothetical protein
VAPPSNTSTPNFDSATQPAAVDELLAKMVRIGPSAVPEYRDRSNSRGYWVNNNVEDFAVFKLKLAEIITGTKLAAEDLQGFSDAFTPLPLRRQNRWL